MVADLGASEHFTAEFLDERENWSRIEQAQILCSEVCRLSNGQSMRALRVQFCTFPRRDFSSYPAVKHSCVSANMLTKQAKSSL